MRSTGRKKVSVRGIAILSIFMILVLAACGSSSSYNAASQSAEAKDSYDGDTYAAGEAAYDMETADGGTDAGGGGQSAGTEEAGTEAAESNQKLVYTCSMEIQTLTFSETSQKVHEVIRQYNGIIQSESTTDSDYEWYREDNAKRRGTLSAYLVIRIPTDKYEDFLASLEGTGGKITTRSMDVQNITQVYNDQTVYIASLEKQEERLLQMMEQAQTIEEMITVEERLTEVQTSLNQARSRLAGMDTDVAYSTVSLSLTEVVRYTDNPVKKKTFLERTGAVIAGSFSGFLEVMEMVLDILIYLLPYAVLIGAIVAIILFATRKKRAERRKEWEERKKQMREREQQGFGRGRGPNGPQNAGFQNGGLQGRFNRETGTKTFTDRENVRAEQMPDPGKMNRNVQQEFPEDMTAGAKPSAGADAHPADSENERNSDFESGLQKKNK